MKKAGNIVTAVSYALVQIGWAIAVITYWAKDKSVEGAIFLVAMSVVAGAIEIAMALKSAKATLTINLVGKGSA